MKRAGICLLILGLLCCCGCNLSQKQTENDPANLALIPYAFVGSIDDWLVRVEIREITAEDISQIGEVPQDVEESQYQQGWRSVVHMEYRGDELLKDLKYYFGGTNQWVFTGSNEARDFDYEAFTKAYVLENDLGGMFYGEDPTVVGGPVPPKNLDYEFEIVWRTVDGKKHNETFTLVAE